MNTEKTKVVIEKYQMARAQMQKIRDTLATEMMAIDDHISLTNIAIAELGEVFFADMERITEKSALQASIRMAQEARKGTLDAYFSKVDAHVKSSLSLAVEALACADEMKAWKSSIVIDLFQKSGETDIEKFVNAYHVKYESDDAFDEYKSVKTSLGCIAQIGKNRVFPAQIDRVWRAFESDHTAGIIEALKLGF